MDIRYLYEQWLGFDLETKMELQSISDEKDIKDRFYKDLEFGTGGLRGIMGAGTNRMNAYTVRRATLGIANYLNNSKQTVHSAVIAYDSRNHSQQYAHEAASVFCACGINTFLFDTLMPTPVLSFAVKDLHCDLGVVITASHNPKEYNGYKVYDQFGCQLVPSIADEVIASIRRVVDYSDIPTIDLTFARKSGLLRDVGPALLDRYLDVVRLQSASIDSGDLKIVYTPLHGSGNIPVRRILKDFNLSIVAEQELPDGEFSTVESPNPEDKSALVMALRQAERENADLVFGTDPDCDRIGVGVKHNGEYFLLSGNQIGALLVDFILKTRKVNSRSTIIKTIVTNDLGADIGKKHGLKVINTLTGFKYIGEQITVFETSDTNEFLIGYEESYGFLVGMHARDKDAVVTSLILSEMAAYHKKLNKSLVNALEDLYNEYGFYLDFLDSFIFTGADGAAKIQNMMGVLRQAGTRLMPGIVSVQDYSIGIDGLPKENVLKFILDDASWFAVRPSGTEPRIKIYYSIKGANRELANIKLDSIRKQTKETLQL